MLWVFLLLILCKIYLILVLSLLVSFSFSIVSVAHCLGAFVFFVLFSFLFSMKLMTYPKKNENESLNGFCSSDSSDVGPVIFVHVGLSPLSLICNCNNSFDI